MDARKYDVLFNNVRIGTAYVSPDQSHSKNNIATIVPIQRSGEWIAGTSEITLEKTLSESFANTLPDQEILQELASQVMIEPWKVEFRRRTE